MTGLDRGRVALRVAVLLGLLCWLGGTGSALAAGTFVVDGADPTRCSDTAPGAGTEGNPPYCTISAAAAARGGPGTTIFVKPGIYREEVKVRASGAEGSPFVFQALGPGVVIDGADDLSVSAQWRTRGFDLDPQSWVTIDGFTITRTGTGIYAKGSSNLTVTHNTVTFVVGGGIIASGCTNVLIGANVVSDAGGISLNGSGIIQDNEVFRSGGIRLVGSGLLQRNNVHDNGGTGIEIGSSGSTSILSLQNRSWRNGGHGFHLSQSSGPHRHVGDVAWGNAGRGFSVGWGATNTHIFNSIGVDNGLTTGEYNLYVDSTATPGFVSNANLFWNSTSQAPIKYAGTKYATLAAFTAATGHDAASLQADPWFVHPVGGDFRLLPGSPAIDAADSSVPNWPATDAAGNTRVDDPATRDTGVGPVLYADRGALEFLPVGPPLAALTVRPSSGIAPLTVTADASRSADPDGTIVSYLYNFGDGTVVGPQAAATASHTYQQVGTFTVTVTVTDAEGGTAAATAPVTVAPPNEPPVAALTVTPASGTVPLAVTADASASSDLDGTLVAYRFDFGDGTVLSPQAAPTATHTYFRPGIFTVTVTVTDDLGATASVTVTVTVAAPQSWNFVENPSFEFGTRGWTAYGGATILQVPGGVEGAYALQVRGPASTATFGINDSPNWVGQTSAAGDRYRFTAWVRSPTSSARARLRVREYLNGVQVGGTTYSPFVALTPAWQPLLVDHVAQAASSSLDFQVLALPLAPGAIFETDHIAIRIVTTTSNQPPDGGIDSPAGDVTIGRCQSVHFTSTGSDPDNHLPLTYLWDFAGGEAQQRGEDPGHVEFCTLGTYIVTLTVEDSLGLADPTPARRVITVFPGRGDNQVGNPSFETDTKGWGTYGGSTIQRVAGGLEGAFALEVRGPASTATFGINDSPNWVAKTLAAGTPYSFSAWVRAEASTGRVRLRVREYLNGVQVGATTYSPFVPLTSAWQLLSAGHVAQAAGSTLDVQILDYPVAPGEVFQVDNIFIFVP